MIVLCVVRVDNKPIIKVDEAFRNVPWSSLIMCAATLALGYMLKHDGVGLSSFLKDNLGQSIRHLSPILLLIIFGVWAALQTNVSSNMVTATLVASVAFMVLKDYAGLETKVIICIIGYLASLAFATPPSMPHIAIIGSSEYCSTKDVLIFGSIIMAISVLMCCLVGYPLGLLLL
jgi:sodium-dependent dicarboxylate transporter 2/3/5